MAGAATLVSDHDKNEESCEFPPVLTAFFVSSQSACDRLAVERHTKG